jgi:predicted acylesterase/phospholipase RssA
MFAYLSGILEGKVYKSPWTISSVNVATGEYTMFDQENTPFSDIVHVGISSASIPGVFPPHYYNGNYYMDGGTVLNTNIVSAIQ